MQISYLFRGLFWWFEILDSFKVLLLDFVITCLIVPSDIYVLICWQLDEMFGNYP